jgi:hypothetical protein
MILAVSDVLKIFILKVVFTVKFKEHFQLSYSYLTS